MEKHHTIESIKSFRKDLKRHFLMATLFVFLYWSIVLIGALIFFYIEHCYDVTPPELDSITQNYFKLCQVVETLTSQCNITNGNSTNATASSLSTKAWLDMCSEDNQQQQRYVRSCDLKGGSLLIWVEYTQTICYTIGYGAVVTRSQTGRLVTIFYAIPAIGITMAMNIFIANIFVDGTKILIVLFYSKILKREKVHHLSAIVFCYQTFLSILLWMSYGYICYKYLFYDGLTFIDGIYYSFVTFSTIGFGDISKNRSSKINVFQVILLLLTFYTGMAVVASALSGMSDFFTAKKRKKSTEKKKEVDVKDVLEKEKC